MRALALVALAACASPSDPLDTTDGGIGVDSGSGSSANDDSLDPLAVGRTWTYDVTSTYASCPGGTRESRVTAEGTTGGRPTFTVAGYCGYEGHSNVDGDLVEDYYDWGPTGWMRSLDAPVAAGHTWETTNGSATFGMTYSDEGTVDGHASCWKVTQNVSYTTYWVYCRSVGLVKYEMIDLTGGTIRAELTHTNF